jgi:DNA-binding IclR family transcriptional regulator
MWRRAVGAAGKLLDILADVYPNAMARAELAKAAGLEASGGTFSTYLSRLSGNGLIDKDGDTVKASDDLFLRLGDAA